MFIYISCLNFYDLIKAVYGVKSFDIGFNFNFFQLAW